MQDILHKSRNYVYLGSGFDVYIVGFWRKSGAFTERSIGKILERIYNLRNSSCKTEVP